MSDRRTIPLAAWLVLGVVATIASWRDDPLAGIAVICMWIILTAILRVMFADG